MPQSNGARRVVLSPDSFKGSASAAEVAAALGRGLRTVLPDLDVVEHPIADGGEGTVEAVVRSGLLPVCTTVCGPLGQPLRAAYAVSARHAVVELAEAAGLGCLPAPGPTPATARTATTRGVGELILHAVEGGATRVTLGIGGSCTTDGGAGLLSALGARVVTADGHDVGPGGTGLLDVAHLDLAGLDPRLRETDIVVACDVDNPLVGSEGAAAVYAPQKGAGAEDVALLERGLQRWADAVAETTGVDLRDLPGAGAAGGVGFALAATLGARLEPGAPLLLEATGFHRHLAPGALVVTGEGSFDRQSLRGKGPMAVARAARDASARVAVVAGCSTVSAVDAAGAGVDAVFTLLDLEPDPATCITDAERLLEETGRRVARWWAAQLS
jgi:glycerate kinase